MHVIFIESNPAGITGFLKALNLGIEITFITADKSFYLEHSGDAKEVFAHPGMRLIETPYVFDAIKLKSIIDKFRGTHSVDGVTTYSEYHIVPTAELAKELGLQGMNPEGAVNARFKQKTRETLFNADLPQPKFIFIESLNKLSWAANKIGFPVILKTVDGTAGMNVNYVTDEAEVESIRDEFQGIEGDYGRGTVRAPGFLVEEFISGDLVSVESCAYDNKIENFGITDRKLVGFPKFIEMGGTFSLAHPLYQELFDLNKKVLQALKVDFGFVHSEYLIKDHKPILLEVNARLAGGILPRMFEAASGIDPFIEVMNIAARKEVRLPYPKNQVCTGRQFGSPISGVYLGVKMGETLKTEGFVEAISYGEKGKKIPSLTDSNFDWLGHIIYTGENQDESLKRTESALRDVRLVLEVNASV